MRSTSITKLAAAALATAAVVPAAALASGIGVEKVTLDHAVGKQATVNFQTDAPLPRRENGGIKGSVTFDGGVNSIGTVSHDDNRYTSWVKAKKALKPGMKFKVRIAIDGQAPIVRTLKLR